MDNTIQNISYFTVLVDVCSILGLVVGIYTLVRTGTIKASVEDVKRKFLFSSSAYVTVEDLTRYRELYLKALESKDILTIKEMLYKLKTTTEILIRSIPSDYKKKCKILIKQLNRQYRSKINFEKKCTLFNRTDIDGLWDTYCKVSGLIDITNNIINENKILS